MSVASGGKVSRGAVVRFPAYRRFDAIQIEASNAMMALLAGAQLASHLLQLTEGSDQLLPAMFPRVEHIRRFSLTSEAAQTILRSAGDHLGAMSVPYALAIHEDHLKTCLEMLETAGRCRKGTAEGAKLVHCHPLLEKAAGVKFDADALAQLDTLRLMRNSLIHNGGRASRQLVACIGRWSPAAEANWVRLAKRNPKGLDVGDTVTLGHTEMILTLAVTKGLAREANVMLQSAVPTTQWADIVIEDMAATDPHVLSASAPLRKARGVARHHYLPLGLTDGDLQAAISRHS